MGSMHALAFAAVIHSLILPDALAPTTLARCAALPQHAPCQPVARSVRSRQQQQVSMCERTPRIQGGAKAPSSTHAEFSIAPRSSHNGVADHQTAADGSSRAREVLKCRIKGFYPFPGDVPAGIFGWLFRDTHQAILVRTSAGSDSLFMDFMTEGGAAHPVWWDEALKWQVLLGQSIDGEVRVRVIGEGGAPGSKLRRLREAAEDYSERPLNLYVSNCRIFCARMQREVERLNAEDADVVDARWRRRASELAADARLAAAILRAGTLPLAYPAGVLLLCWDGLTGL